MKVGLVLEGGALRGLYTAGILDVWLEDVNMPVVDSLGDEFLEYVQDGMTVRIEENGVVIVE